MLFVLFVVVVFIENVVIVIITFDFVVVIIIDVVVDVSFITLNTVNVEGTIVVAQRGIILVGSHDEVVYNNTTKYTYDVSVIGAVVSLVLSFVPSVHVVVSNISATAATP